MTDLTVTISPRDIPDFYAMVRHFTRYNGNTFCYIKKELEKRFPELMDKYKDDDTDYWTPMQRSRRRQALFLGYLEKKGYEERMNLYKPKWLQEFRQNGCQMERNLAKYGFNVIIMEDDGESEGIGEPEQHNVGEIFVHCGCTYQIKEAKGIYDCKGCCFFDNKGKCKSPKRGIEFEDCSNALRQDGKRVIFVRVDNPKRPND